MPGIWRSLKTEKLGWSQERWAVLVCAAHLLSGFTSPVSLVKALRHLRSLHNFLYISNSHFQFLKKKHEILKPYKRHKQPKDMTISLINTMAKENY